MSGRISETCCGPVDEPVPVDPLFGPVVGEDALINQCDAALEAASGEPRWHGGLTPYAVGDPGRAAHVVRAAPDLQFWEQRDTILDGVLVADASGNPALELRAASVRGLSHRYYGRARQDEYAYRRTTDAEFLVVAVADGVSAGRYSHHAAQVITRQGCVLIADLLREVEPAELAWADVLDHLASAVVEQGRQVLREHGGRHDADGLDPRTIARDLAATALLAVVDLRPGTAERTAHLFGLGDTSAWVLRSGSRWEALQAIKNDGVIIATSAVPALPLIPSEPCPPMRVVVGPEDALVLVSDGIGDPLGDGTGDVGTFLASAWSRPPTALDFAAQVGFARKSYDDDRTAVGLWPQPPASAGL